jgi:hypothetical protein
MISPFDISAFCLLPSAFMHRLEIFSGAADPAEARIYARLKLSRDEVDWGCQLTGNILGPQCAFSHTLPARIPMMNRSDGSTLLLEAIVPDPCFWTPELPFLYRAKIELRREQETIAICERIVGIRRFGVRERSLNFDGKRFVLRGVDFRSHISNLRLQIAEQAAFLRETWTALVVSHPDDELCEFASRNGVLLIADLASKNDFAWHGQAKSARAEAENDLTCKLHRLAQWPAVVVAIVDGEADLPSGIHEIARNLLLAQRIVADVPWRQADWAQIAIVEAANPNAFADKMKGCSLPIIAYRPQSASIDIESARAACDALQRDLASCGGLAGYVV